MPVLPAPDRAGIDLEPLSQLALGKPQGFPGGPESLRKVLPLGSGILAQKAEDGGNEPDLGLGSTQFPVQQGGRIDPDLFCNISLEILEVQSAATDMLSQGLGAARVTL